MRIIFHIDVNAAFLSWTAAYRCPVLGEQQDLRDIPAAIAGEKANRHGIILAKSLPAKRMGVKTGEPIFQAVKKMPPAGHGAAGLRPLYPGVPAVYRAAPVLHTAGGAVFH